MHYKLNFITVFVEMVCGIDMALGRSDWYYDEIGVAGGYKIQNFNTNIIYQKNKIANRLPLLLLELET